jgi:hypothetical protein
MAHQRRHDYPKIEFESDGGGEHEGNHEDAFDNESLTGSSHDREQDIVRGNHDNYCGIESAIVIELHRPCKQRYKYRKDDSDCVSHGTSFAISWRRVARVMILY